MPIDQTLRGLALEIDASVDPAPKPSHSSNIGLLILPAPKRFSRGSKEFRYLLAEASWLSKRARRQVQPVRGCLSTIKATSALEPRIRSLDWKSPAT